jgi:hypothetical protein
VATFSDGTQVLVTGGSSSGNNIWQQALEIIAGPAGFSGLANLQVQPVDSNPGDAWTGTTEYISGWKVAATLGDGSTDTVSLPFEGSSGVPACLFD